MQVLLENFLGFEVIGDDDDRAIWKQSSEESGQERLGGGADGVEGQSFAPLHACAQGLHGWSLRDDRK